MSTLLTAATRRQTSRCSGRELVNCKLEQGQRRSVSDHGHFYRNRQLELYAAKEARRLTLRQLVRLFSNPFGSPRSPQPKMNGFLGLVWPFHDSRPVDQSEGASRHQLMSLTIFLTFAPHSERELCAGGVAGSDISSSAGPASVTVCRSDEGGGCQSLRGVCSPCLALSPNTDALANHARSSAVLVGFRKVRKGISLI